MINREDFYNAYEDQITFDETIEYKNISIVPVRVRKWRDFFISSSCLSINKNQIADIEIIKMSYLDFIYSLIAAEIQSIENEEEILTYSYVAMFFNIFNICCGLTPENISFNFDERQKVFLTINGEKYDKNDFDNIRKIILFQNLPDYDDTYIDPELEQAIKETDKILHKGITQPTLEKQITAIVSSSGYTYENVYDMTIRKFLILLRTIDTKLHYQIYKTASLHPYVEFKEDIEHWLYEKKKNRLHGKIMGYDELTDKMKHVI